jgi:CRISPR-associated Csx3 family protein
MFVLEIILKDGLISPDQLPELLKAAEAALPAAGKELVVLSGRLPVWAFAALAHLYHPRPWVATYDPRLGGGVVVQSHDQRIRVGEIIPTEGAITIKLEF